MAPGTNAELEVWRVTTDGGDFLQTLRRLADGGNAHVMFRLGRMYATGIGVARDEVEAVAWYRKSASAGNSSAKTSLAVMVIEGRGVAKDQQEGVRLLREAADKDNNEAMYRLGVILIDGKIVAKDAAEAMRLFTKGSRGRLRAVDAGSGPCCTTTGTAWRPIRSRRRRGTSAPPTSAAPRAWSTSFSCIIYAGAWRATSSPRWPST
jgi:hypothetical protein